MKRLIAAFSFTLLAARVAVAADDADALFEYAGSREKDGVRLTVSFPNGYKIGELVLRTRRGALEGSGNLQGVPVRLTGHRPRVRAANAPRRARSVAELTARPTGNRRSR